MVEQSKDLAFLVALTDWLAGIGPASGYQTYDLQGRVFRGRLLFGDSDEPPFLSILEAPKTDDQGLYAAEGDLKRIERWDLLIQGFAADDSENDSNPTDVAYNFQAVVAHRLSRLIAQNPATGNPVDPVNYLLGFGRNGVSKIHIGPGFVSPPRKEVSNWAFFYLPISVLRVYDPSCPFV